MGTLFSAENGRHFALARITFKLKYPEAPGESKHPLTQIQDRYQNLIDCSLGDVPPL